MEANSGEKVLSSFRFRGTLLHAGSQFFPKTVRTLIGFSESFYVSVFEQMLMKADKFHMKKNLPEESNQGLMNSISTSGYVSAGMSFGQKDQR